MIIWLDAQLPPALAPWINSSFAGIEAFSALWLNLHEATDLQLWQAAVKAHATVMTKDRDFVHLLHTHGSPPKVIWITCGNTSNLFMRNLLLTTFHQALQLLNKGEDLVEISDLATINP